MPIEQGGDAWSFYESLEGQNRATLTQAEREVAAICDLRQEVNSGGFDSYLRYWGGDTAPEALVALPKVLGPEWADLLRAAMALLGPEYPADTATREDRIDERELDDVLDALDTRYYRLEESVDADSLLSSYLANSR